MPKVQTDVGAIATALGKIFDLIKLRINTREIRDLRSAAIVAQKAFKRAVKLYPKLKKDKTFMKHKDRFDKKII